MLLNFMEPAPFEPDIRPVPVLHAASRQRRLWPYSTPALPFSLREIGGRCSSLLRNLQAIEATAAYERPIVVMLEEAAVRGTMEVQRVRSDATIVVVPAGTGSGISSILAALLSGKKPLALIPSSFTADNPVEAFTYIAAQFRKTRNYPVLLASRAANDRDGMCMQLGTRKADDESLFCVENLHIRGNGALAAVLEETSSLVRSSGPVVMPADYLIERMDAIWPTLLSASRNALSLKQEVGSITRPHANFLRLAGRPGIRDLLQAVLPEVTAIIGKPDWRTVQTFRDPFFDRLDGGVQVPLGIGGYPDHRVIASTDGIFIVKPGHEDEAKNWYPENAPAGLQIPGQRTYPTLRFSA